MGFEEGGEQEGAGEVGGVDGSQAFGGGVVVCGGRAGDACVVEEEVDWFGGGGPG